MAKLLLSIIVASTAVAALPAAADNAAHIVVPTHDIARGTIIAAADLGDATLPQNNVFSGIARSADELIGMEARRALRAGELVRIDDVRHPILVTKGAIVTMSFEAPGVLLTATGKALSEGGLGESVTVLNPVSFRQVTATVTGAGAVRVNSGAFVAGVATARR